MINRFAKGSLWRKCDLHAHTPLDHEWISRPDLSTEEKKRVFAKEYIEFASQEGLEIIGVTDHNFCNQIDDLILPYIIEAAISKSLTILPGFEITVKDGSGIHVLVLFKENTSLNEIYEVVKRLFPLGTVLTPLTGIIPVCEKDLDGLKFILDGSKLDYLLIFAHADRENGVLDKSTIVGERRVQEWQKEYINVCQLSKRKEDFLAGSFISTVINKTNTHYSRDITYIVSSDCRTISKTALEEGRQYLGQKFTWIKADATFEGLKQIVFEPNSRVRVQDDKPEQKRPYLFIDKVRFKTASGDLTFPNTFIEINSNLNSIIGGKSSGKSLLLYYIAKTLDPIQLETKYNDLQVSEIYIFEDELPEFDFEVIWGDGTLSKLTDPVESKNRQITYIPQMYINHLAEKRGNDELKKLIQSILEEKPEFLEFYSTSKSEISRLRGLISNNIFQYFEKTKNLITIQGQIKGKGDKDARKQNLLQRNAELAALRIEAGFTAEQEQDYEKQLNNRNLHDSRKKSFETLLEIILNDYTVELERIEEEVKKSIKKLRETTLSKFVGSENVQNAYSKKIGQYEEELLKPFQSIYLDVSKKAEKIERLIQKSQKKFQYMIRP